LKYDPCEHHRRSIRLQGYDYAQAGAYFVTICTQNRECFFGDAEVGEMRLNDAGRMAQTVWEEMSIHYACVETDTFVVMPNHIHGIIVLVGAAPRGRPEYGSPLEKGRALDGGQPRGVAPTLSLAGVVHRFKTMTTKRYVDGVKQFGWPPFCGRLWQRNYYEHIIRDEDSLNRIREYIINNPLQWEFDPENPVGRTPGCLES
jgi:REP element-mobilizing transposase RayT